MNDLQIASDGLVLVGHAYMPKITEGCWFDGCGSIAGMMMKLDTNGNKQWSKTYGNYPGGINQFRDAGAGSWALIYNECWGVANTYDSSGNADGYALACGTGIENCDLTNNMGPLLLLECYADPRITWRDLTIATDLNGERVWSRMDSFQSGGPAAASASEYIVSDSSNQKLTFISDEASGFGFGTISAPDGVKCADEVSAVKLTVSSLIALGALYLSI